MRQTDLFIDTDAELDWNMPTEYPDRTGYKQIAIDLETYDPNLITLGPGWARNDGYIVGVAKITGQRLKFRQARADAWARLSALAHGRRNQPGANHVHADVARRIIGGHGAA